MHAKIECAENSMQHDDEVQCLSSQDKQDFTSLTQAVLPVKAEKEAALAASMASLAHGIKHERSWRKLARRETTSSSSSGAGTTAPEVK